MDWWKIILVVAIILLSPAIMTVLGMAVVWLVPAIIVATPFGLVYLLVTRK